MFGNFNLTVVIPQAGQAIGVITMIKVSTNGIKLTPLVVAAAVQLAITGDVEIVNAPVKDLHAQRTAIAANGAPTI